MKMKQENRIWEDVLYKRILYWNLSSGLDSNFTGNEVHVLTNEAYESHQSPQKV
jgi:hypothetical protein